jgi:formylglycine-generating enzyme required for sulfatase activity
MASTTFDRLHASASSVLLWAVAAALLVAPAARAQDGCIADVDGDGIVNGNDLASVLGGWGSCGGCGGDVNGNGVINGEDLAVVLTRWGSTCAPTVTGITPDAGPLAGGVVVTITGNNLLTPTSVTFGGTPAPILSSTRSAVSVMAPARPAGTATIVVATQGGSVNAGTFAYYGAPTITGVTPNAGYAGGGEVITITGSGFCGQPTVRFGEALGLSVTVDSENQLRVVSPPGASGSSVSVSVATESGVVDLGGGYSYVEIVVPDWAILIEAVPDPSVVTNAALRAAIASTGFAWRVRDSLTQIEMLLVPPGVFERGCSQGPVSLGCNPWELPVHHVTLTNAFYLGRYEVTQAQWTARTGSNPSHYGTASQEVSKSEVPNRPVEFVSVESIQLFFSATGLRFPTEAEWEYACRAGTTTAFHSTPDYPSGTNDDELLGSIAWFGLNSAEQTRPVGQKAPNALGFHDMLGNVWELVGDWYGGYSDLPQVDPSGPPFNQSGKTLRGGSCYSYSGLVTSATRMNNPNDGFGTLDVGFRVARNP